MGKRSPGQDARRASGGIGKPLLLNTLAGSGYDQTRPLKQEGSPLPAYVGPFIAPGPRHQIIVHRSYLHKGYMGIECRDEAETSEQQVSVTETYLRIDFD